MVRSTTSSPACRTRKVKTSGIDLSLDYLFPNSPYGQFGLSMQGTYVTRYD